MGTEVSIRGLLTAIDWYDDGRARRVALLTEDEGELDVEPHEVCRRLAHHARGWALLRGHLEVDGERPVMRVSSYVILDDDEAGDTDQA